MKQLILLKQLDQINIALKLWTIGKQKLLMSL